MVSLRGVGWELFVCNRLRFEALYFGGFVVSVCVLVLYPVAMLVGLMEYGPGVMFVHYGNVFFGLTKCCVGQCSENIEVGFCLVIMLYMCWFNDMFLSYVTLSVVTVLV